jgi:hypothetical protein
MGYYIKTAYSNGATGNMKRSFQQTSSENSECIGDGSPDTAASSGSFAEGSEETYRNISAAHALPDLDSKYFRSLPSGLNILANASDTIRRITNPEKQREVVTFLLSIQDALLVNRFALDRIGSLSPLRISLNEDDSVLIEWIFRDFRIGFSIETDRSQSNWYLVSNQNLNQVDLSGLLSSQNIGELLSVLIAFVLSNT